MEMSQCPGISPQKVMCTIKVVPDPKLHFKRIINDLIYKLISVIQYHYFIGPSELATSHSGIRTFDRPNTEDGASAMEPVHNTANSPSASCKQLMSESLPQFKHPKYVSDLARLASFQSFPLRRTHSPALLASAGFFYAGR